MSKSSDNDLSQIKTISSIESDIQRGKFVKRKSVQIADIDSIESAKKMSFENIEMEYFDTEHFENVEVESIDVAEKFYTEEAFDLVNFKLMKLIFFMRLLLLLLFFFRRNYINY